MRDKGRKQITRLVAGSIVSLASGLVLAQGIAATNALPGSGVVSIAKPHQYADAHVEGDLFSASYAFTPQAADVGKTATLYAVARIDGGGTSQWYNLTAGKWQRWDGNMATLAALGTKVLQAQEQLQLVNEEPLFAGDYQIFAGYRTNGGALVYSQAPFTFSVAAVDSDTLQRFSSPAAMEAYLKEGLQNASSEDAYIRTLAFTPGLAVDVIASATAGAEGRTSATNVQESGVDEADVVKVAGDKLFMLTSCENMPCVSVQALDSGTASATPVSSFTLDTTSVPDGMYRVEHGILGNDMLVTVAGQSGFGWYRIWGGWQTSKTELNFLNIANPESISRMEQLTFDGALVSSRVVDDTMYLVTRYTPSLPEYVPYPVDKAQRENNLAVLERADLPQILPRVRDSHEDVATLVQSKDCYLPVSAVDANSNPTIVTITAVPLNNPTAHKSTCFLGASETLYTTPDALYLATTSWEYDVTPATALLRYTPNHTTAIHKFALGGGNIEYRGSGSVKGHLGWHEDKKSFRMGANGAYLNVATSLGEVWDNTSSTRLTVLKDAGNKRLEPASVIDGIGKPGEQLYAARFAGDRAYLVTFRVTDPLYVVDLANQENPRIAGELQIDGYSDYLHPISANLLLGIGKDAIATETATDFGGRGAWYQGVKLALFDVSNPAQPREIDSLVLGKRGTDSDLLWDHHALSYLPPSGTEPARIALPVRLHDTTPTWERFDPAIPNAYYDYTHTGLYSFELSAQGIAQAGRIVAELAPPPVSSGGDGTVVIDSARGDTASNSLFAPIFIQYNDRSVLKDDAVFYIHEGKVLGSFWGEDKNP